MKGKTNFLFLLIIRIRLHWLQWVNQINFLQMDFIYWNSVSYKNDNTLLRFFIFHKPRGKMSVNILKTVIVNKKMKFYKCILSE